MKLKGREPAAMAPAEVAALRETLGMTRDQLAEELGRTDVEVGAWESGRLPVDARTAYELRLRVALRERSDGVDAAGLPRCEWMEAQELREVVDLDRLSAHARMLEEHLDRCPTCIARARYADEHFPPLPPEPLPGGIYGVVEAALRWIGTLPKRARPGAYGAAIGLFLGIPLGAMYLVAQMIRQGPLDALRSAETLGALWLPLTMMVLVASGGIMYGLVRPRLKPLGLVGDYLTGMACILAYLLPGIPLIAEPGDMADPAFWIIMLAMSSVFGVVLGHSWFRKEDR